MRRVLDGPVASAPAPAATSTTDSEDAYFSSSLFIIFAALLCTLIFMVAVNSMVRCAIRCSGRRRRQNAEEGEEEAAAAGIKKEALRQIPIVAYSGDAAGAVKGTDCAICLGEFIRGKKVRVLPECHHGFHVKCIDTWLALHSSCPTCRREVAVLVASKGGSPSSSSEVGGATSTAGRQFVVAPELVRDG